MAEAASQKEYLMSTMPLRAGHFRVLFVASLGQLIGTGLATLVGIIIPMIQILAHPELSAFMQGLLGCMNLIGICIGSLILGPLTDRYGYLGFFRACPALILVASLVALWVHTIPVLLICLFLMGFGIGGEYSLDSDYISEIMPKRWQHFMVGVAKASSALGNIIVAAVCYFLITRWDAASSWPKLLWIMVAISGLMLVLRLNFAESPRWLLDHGEKAKAEKAAQFFLGKDVEIEPVKPTPPAQEKESTLAFIRRNFRQVVLSGVPWACEGLGVYGIGVFLPILVMALGIEHESAHATQIAHVAASVETTFYISCIILPGFVIGLLLINKIYQISLQTWGFFGSAISLTVLLFAYMNHWPAWISIVAFMCFELCLNLGPHLITYVLPSVIYPVAERGQGSGLAACIGKIGAVVAVFFIPMLLKWGGAQLVLIVSIAVMVAGGWLTGWLGPKVLPNPHKK
ncbi:MAG: sugar porter family MFS transporter [Duncaniella sp.]|nr:sugar porter family MFS transporter [Duncaniella sp.]